MLTRFLSITVAFLFATVALAQDYTARGFTSIPPVAGILAHNGMVVAQESRAARIGVEILDRGGNAVDAAVAVGFAMAVTYPRAGNIGGGGFMVIHLAKGVDTAIDYRETAPAAATPTMFLDAQGNADPKKSRDSGLAVGVPGTVAGLAMAEQKYGSGRFTLADLIAPAIRLAQQGFPVEDDLADSLPQSRERLARWPSTMSILFNGDQPLHEGDRLIQPDLADTLRGIAKDGPDAFYKGSVAADIVRAVKGAGGIMTADDFANYRAVERPVVRGTYRGYDIVSMPPPSSGGVHLIEMLNILEGYDLAKMPREEALHDEVEAMKRAYADRAVYMGDPETVKMPIAGLISKPYAASLRASIGPRATPAADIHAGKPPDVEGRNTTHFSVIDRDGNAVSNTYSLNTLFGAKLVVSGGGFLLNNSMDDFYLGNDRANWYSLVDGDANLVRGGRRPVSSMAPTLVSHNGRVRLIIGGSGGPRIPTMIAQILLSIDELSLLEAMQTPRIHHQYTPETVLFEPGTPETILAALSRSGFHLREQRALGIGAGIKWIPETNELMAVLDPRFGTQI